MVRKIVAVLLVARVAVAQQPATSARSALLPVPPTARIRLQVTAAPIVSGRLVSVNDTAVLLQTGTTQTISFDRVQTVWLRSASSAKRGAITGGLVAGAGTAGLFGLLFAAFCEVSCDNAALEGAAIGAVAGAAGGAVTGGIIGSFFTHWREYWNSGTGLRFRLDSSRTQIIAGGSARWRVEPAVGIGWPLDGSRTAHIPVQASLSVLRELRPGRSIGFEAGYLRPDLSPRPFEREFGGVTEYNGFDLLGLTNGVYRPNPILSSHPRSKAEICIPESQAPSTGTAG